MTATWIFIGVLLVSLVASLYLHVAALKWGLKRAKVADISFIRAFGLWFLLMVLAGVCLGIIGIALSIEPSMTQEMILSAVTWFIVSLIAVTLIYKSSWMMSAKAVMPHAILEFALVAAILFILRPFIFEAFVISSNSMAPTLVGEHVEVPCPTCGHPAFGSLPEPGRENMEDGVLMICSNEFRTVKIRDPILATGESDRIAVCKLISPRRWDLVVFKYPDEPSTYYVMRLIGLPGEHLSIHDDAVWINDRKLELPVTLRGIQYKPTIQWMGTPYSGPGSAPVTLGADEYFVLGDFADQSSDSRFWRRGAPGHAPYAVPESHIVGVAINIYWPINRWRAFR